MHNSQCTIHNSQLMTYDESIKKAEAIIAQLESSEALSMEEYRLRADEAEKLLKQCEAEVDGLFA